jgi:sensor histidine kinase regulating citrate/malate metabolism
MVLAQNLTLSFSSESSIQDELNRESTADAITIVVNILYMQNSLMLLRHRSFNCMLICFF